MGIVQTNIIEWLYGGNNFGKAIDKTNVIPFP